MSFLVFSYNLPEEDQGIQCQFSFLYLFLFFVGGMHPLCPKIILLPTIYTCLLFLLQIAGLVSCSLILVVLLAIGPYFRTLPNVSIC